MVGKVSAEPEEEPRKASMEGGIYGSGGCTPFKTLDDLFMGSALARPPMNQEQFDAQFAYHEPKKSELETRMSKFCKRYTTPFSSWDSFKYAIIGFLPILEWLPNYDKKWLPYDVIGGLTVGVMHVPQGIAYAILAKVPAVNGLYTSFFPPLIYSFFGTSRHNSLGSFAVVSLMCGMAVTKITENNIIEEELAISDNSTLLDDIGMISPPTPDEIASTLTLLCGLVNFIMAILRLDFMTTYFSDQVVSGFTTGASVHVFVSQLKGAFGLRRLPRRTGYGYIIMNLYDIVIRLPTANPYTTSIALFSVLFLILGKDVLSVFLKRRCRITITFPYELLLIILVTTFSFIFHFEDQFQVQVVGDIPTSLPIPSPPRIDLIPDLIWDALAITVVVVAVHISLAKMFAKKLSYEMDSNQELVALGVTSTLSSFFPVYPVACSLGRTLLNVEVGTRSLLSNLFSSLFLLSIIVYLGRFFGPLPMPVLSAIVIVALKGMLNKFMELRTLWPISKIDFSVWVVSFLATAFIDVTPGLAISICYALFTTIAREQWPNWHLLGNVHGTFDFKDSERYDDVFFFHAICIFRFDSPLLFTNVDRFKKCISKALIQWETSHEYYVFRIERTKTFVEADPEKGVVEGEEILEEGEALSRHFIVDCSGLTFVDYMGVSALKEIYVEMRNRGVLVYFAAAKAAVREMFANCGFYDMVSKDNFYPTIRDAVAIARMRQKARGQQDTQYSLEHDRLSEIMSSQPMH